MSTTHYKVRVESEQSDPSTIIVQANTATQARIKAMEICDDARSGDGDVNDYSILWTRKITTN
jgi:hypothetical protein